MRNRVFRYLILILISVLFFSCTARIWQYYPEEMEKAKVYLIEGKEDLAEKEISIRLGSYRDRLLRHLELGMVLYLKDDFEGSIREWLCAERLIEEFDQRPVISIKDMGEKISALAVNDYLMTYRGMAYERVLLHIYLSLTYLMSSDHEGARVELKKAEQAQKKGLQRYEEYRDVLWEDAKGAREMEGELFEVYRSRYGLRGEYDLSGLNPFVYYLSGWLYRAEGYPYEALIDYRRVWNLGIRSDFLFHDIEQTENGSGPSGRRGVEKGGEVIIIYQQGLIPNLEEFDLPLIIDGSLVMFSIPVYADTFVPMSRLQVRTGAHEIITEEMVNVYALAKGALRERAIGIAIRQLARMALKTVISRQMSEKGGALASIISNIYNVISERADLRSWMTIPISIQFGRMILTPGQHLIDLNIVGNGLGTQVMVDIEAGGYKIIDVRAMDAQIIVHTS